jgi:hypothetical protein
MKFNWDVNVQIFNSQVLSQMFIELVPRILVLIPVSLFTLGKHLAVTVAFLRMLKLQIIITLTAIHLSVTGALQNRQYFSRHTCFCSVFARRVLEWRKL